MLWGRRLMLEEGSALYWRSGTCNVQLATIRHNLWRAITNSLLKNIHRIFCSHLVSWWRNDYIHFHKKKNTGSSVIALACLQNYICRISARWMGFPDFYISFLLGLLQQNRQLRQVHYFKESCVCINDNTAKLVLISTLTPLSRYYSYRPALLHIQKYINTLFLKV